jgi:hypothetical protein
MCTWSPCRRLIPIQGNPTGQVPQGLKLFQLITNRNGTGGLIHGSGRPVVQAYVTLGTPLVFPYNEKVSEHSASDKLIQCLTVASAVNSDDKKKAGGRRVVKMLCLSCYKLGLDFSCLGSGVAQSV